MAKIEEEKSVYLASMKGAGGEGSGEKERDGEVES